MATIKKRVVMVIPHVCICNVTHNTRKQKMLVKSVMQQKENLLFTRQPVGNFRLSSTFSTCPVILMSIFEV